MINWLAAFTVWLQEPPSHVLISIVTGFLFALFFLTVVYVPYTVVCFLSRSQANTTVVYIIIALSVIAGIGFAAAVSSALDAWDLWWQTPLGPPLDLDVGISE